MRVFDESAGTHFTRIAATHRFPASCFAIFYFAINHTIPFVAMWCRAAAAIQSSGLGHVKTTQALPRNSIDCPRVNQRQDVCAETPCQDTQVGHASCRKSRHLSHALLWYVFKDTPLALMLLVQERLVQRRFSNTDTDRWTISRCKSWDTQQFFMS